MNAHGEASFVECMHRNKNIILPHLVAFWQGHNSGGADTRCTPADCPDKCDQHAGASAGGRGFCWDFDHKQDPKSCNAWGPGAEGKPPAYAESEIGDQFYV